MDKKVKRRLIIIGGTFILLLMIGIILALSLSEKSKVSEMNQRGDTAQEDIIDTPAASNYTNFHELTDRGLTHDQLKGFQYALYNYVESKDIHTDNFSIDASTVKDAFSESESGVFVMSFDITVRNHKTLKAKLERSELTVIRLYLFDSNGVQVYDSGSIDTFDLRDTP